MLRDLPHIDALPEGRRARHLVAAALPPAAAPSTASPCAWRRPQCPSVPSHCWSSTPKPVTRRRAVCRRPPGRHRDRREPAVILRRGRHRTPRRRRVAGVTAGPAGLAHARGPTPIDAAMTLDAGQRLLIHRSDMHRTRMAPDPDSPALRPLQPGQARLAVEHFALTANNITYAAFGEAMKYWQFFPGRRPRLGLPAGVGLCHGCRIAHRGCRGRATLLGLLSVAAPGRATRASGQRGLRRCRHAPPGARRGL